MNTVEILKQAKRVIHSVRGIKLKGWNMNDWGEPASNSPCGTVRCALGHIASDPWFTRRGLRLISEEGKSVEKADPVKGGVIPFYKNNMGSNAFADMSGILWEEADELFINNMRNKPKDTMRKLDVLIKRYAYR